jgi:hypothetical protein
MLKTICKSMIGVLLISAGSVLADSDHEAGVSEKFDLNRDGVITRAEYDKAFEMKMKKKLTWLDINRDGVISPEEFIGRHRNEFDHRWANWDSNGDGVISTDVVIRQQQEKRVVIEEEKRPEE